MADRLGRRGVWTLAELDGKDFPGVPLAVLGYPVGHSISPQMHNGALAAMADGWPEAREWRYHKLEIPPEALPGCPEQAFRETIPGTQSHHPAQGVGPGTCGGHRSRSAADGRGQYAEATVQRLLWLQYRRLWIRKGGAGGAGHWTEE